MKTITQLLATFGSLVSLSLAPALLPSQALACGGKTCEHCASKKTGHSKNGRKLKCAKCNENKGHEAHEHSESKAETPAAQTPAKG